MEKLLITGASGFLGWNLCSFANSRYSVVGVWNNHPIEISGSKTRQCDITDYKQLKNLFIDEKPNAVIHTAAASNPNFCQLNPEKTHKINVTASSNIAGLCADLNIPCLFTSTDLVFDGKAPPYKETDVVTPVNIYGQQKVIAENEMLSRYENVTICRMPLMFGDVPDKASSFIQPWIGQLQNGNTLSLFTDEIRSPVSARNASQGLLMALEKVRGILHLGGKERLSRYDMGRILSDLLTNTSGILLSCKQQDVPMPAPRPTDVSLDSSKAFSLGYSPQNMREGLKKLNCMRL